MSPVNSKHSKRLAHPLVFDTRTLGAGSVLRHTRTAPAPADLAVELASIPEGSELELDVQLEGVTEGVLVTATVRAPLAGECARCLEPVSSTTQVRFRELFGYEANEEEGGYLLDGDLLDLEPALRDALVLELPLAPLCAEDCPGLCVECGIRLAEAGPEHRHAGPDGAGAEEEFDTGRKLLADTPAGSPGPGRRKER
jgi:uncharacterized protein